MRFGLPQSDILVVLFGVLGAMLTQADQPIATDLSPITVTAAVHRFSASGVLLTDALQDEPLVLVNSQGWSGVQDDLSIRGSGFSGAGVSLAGVALRNPQTEHFNLELPLPVGLLSPPQRLTGLDQQRMVDGHLVGTVSFDFRPVERATGLRLEAGERRRNRQDLLYQISRPSNHRKGVLGLSLFASREEDYAVNLPDNDLERRSGGVHLQWRRDVTRADLAFGAQEKTFGARGYYGVSPELAADEQLTDALAILSVLHGSLRDSYARVTVEWRTLRDVYRLFLSPTDLYENRHRSSIWSGFADGRQPVSERWSFAWRAGVDHEVLRSNRLGNHSRSRGVALALPEWIHGPLKVSGGSKLEVFTDGKPEHLPQAGIEYDWREGCKLYASYSEAVRRPSYTELNYESPGSLGNAGLPRQKERSIETGVHTQFDSLSCRAAAFFASSDHTVDWAKLDASAERWEAVDLGRVDTRGFEVECSYRGSILSGTCGYTILSKSSDLLPYASRYVLDFPEHLIRITATWRIVNQCLLTASQGLRWHTENAARSGGGTGFPAHAVLHFSPRAFPFFGVSVAVENLWDDDFETYPGLAAAPRRLSVAATIAW